ncbi:PucR family transcriptional regulator [Candidatus Formimonas warabiya]|uniref:PucR family transcriptional regulator n=1 Tax=Formimonas warabiya TaxID=1761012 RepID=A0A3G1KYY5_FORW1|nr:PucR family transcriptional regulator [Candidatus Formimonas warabiya]ATW27671.1 hypothetical protein DCMF_25555 [Candidatus Formimonas warabiya]
MGLTVRQALKIGKLKDAVVVAGYQGLDNQILFVNIMEVPEVTRWMKGGELLVTAGFAFKDNPNSRKKLIYDLAQKHVAAFGIKPGQYFSEVPQDMIEYANEVGLPLLQLPPDAPYMDFMLPIFEILISGQLSQLKRHEQIHNCLLEALLSGGGFLSICQALYDLLGKPVYILDKSGNIINYVCGLKPEQNFSFIDLTEAWLQIDQDLLNYPPNRSRRIKSEFKGQQHDVVLVPVQADNCIAGYLLVLEDGISLDDQGLFALEYAGTISALEFSKEKAVFEAERKVRGDLLEDLISENFSLEEAVIRRASFLNFNLNVKLAVFIINIDHFEKYVIYQTNHQENHIQEIKSYIFENVHHAFLSYPGGVMLHMKSNCLIGLIRMEGEGHEKVLRQKLQEIIRNIKTRFPKINISVGVGKPYKGVRNIKNSYEEAETSLKVEQYLNGGEKVVFFQELGLYRFLYELKGSETMKTFHDEIVGKLKQYDDQNHSNMVHTLISYFKNDCNLNRTAKDLYIHKNSVIYRVKKIEEITGLKFSNPEDRFNLQLCLKLQYLIE